MAGCWLVSNVIILAMSVAYMDESGELGFDFSKTKTSKNFVVAILFCEDPKPTAKLIKRIFAGFNKTEIKNHHGILHAFRERPETRLKLLKGLAQLDVSILVLRLEKTGGNSQLPGEKHDLYNYIVNFLFDRMIRHKLVPLDQPIEFIASKRETSKILNENFKSYIRGQTIARHGLNVRAEIKTTSQDKGLQAVDCLAWSFFRKYEHGDSSYADIVAEKIIEEGTLFG
jgi:hypothetical protein